MANKNHKIHFHDFRRMIMLIMPIRYEGGRLRRGIFTRVTSSNPPVETDGYDFVYA